MTKMFSFLFEFFQQEFINSVCGNIMHENLERCKRNQTSNSSPKTEENSPPLLISQKWAGDGTCVRKNARVASWLHIRIFASNFLWFQRAERVNSSVFRCLHLRILLLVNLEAKKRKDFTRNCWIFRDSSSRWRFGVVAYAWRSCRTRGKNDWRS